MRASLLLLFLSCGTPQPSPPNSQDLAPKLFEQARQRVLAQTGQLRAAWRGWEESVEAVRLRPGSLSCGGLSEPAVRLDRAWAELREAHELLALRAQPWAQPLAQARFGISLAQEERQRSRESYGLWRSWCAALPETRAAEALWPVQPRRLNETLSQHGDLLLWRAPPVKGPHGGLMVARRLSRLLEDDLDFLILLSALSPSRSYEGSCLFARESGSRAPYRAEHLPRWRRLRAAILINEEQELRQSPLLHHIRRSLQSLGSTAPDSWTLGLVWLRSTPASKEEIDAQRRSLAEWVRRCRSFPAQFLRGDRGEVAGPS